MKEGLEKILKEKVFTQSPYRDDSLKVLLLSDMKCNTSLYNKEAWDSTIGFMKNMYKGREKGYLFIVDGIFESPGANGSKYEFLKMPAYSYNSGSKDWLSDIRREFKKIPKNIEVHYFYGKNDVSNMVDIYNNKIVQFLGKRKNLASSVKKVESLIDKAYTAMHSNTKEKTKAGKVEGYLDKLGWELDLLSKESENFENSLSADFIKGSSSKLLKSTGELKKLIDTYKGQSSLNQFSGVLENTAKNWNAAKKEFSDSYFNLDGKFMRKDVPEEFKKQLLFLVKSEYRNLLNSFMEDKSRFHVHAFQKNYLKLNSNGEEALFEVNGFQEMTNANLSKLRKQEYEKSSRKPTDMETQLIKNREYMKELGLTEKDLSDLLEQEKLGKNIPDFKIVGNDFVFRTMACTFSNERVEPTYLVSLAPFFDVEKARSLSKLSYLNKKHVQKAFRTGASSGVVLLDYNKYSLRVTPMNLDQIFHVKDTLNNIHITDIHSGKEDQRTDLNIAIAYVKKNDHSIESCDETGDRFQSLNYPGSAQEGTNRLARIDDQIIRDVIIHQKADEDIVKRSRLKSAVIRKLKGNHDRPLEPLGISPSKLEILYLNLPYMNKAGISEEELYYAHRLKELGYKTVMDDFPYQTNYLGHEPFAIYNLVTKDGKNYGKLMTSHKATLAGSGDKMDPISRTLEWIANTGRVNFAEKDGNYRLLNQGHSHIWEIAMAFNGFYICAGPSLEAIDKDVDYPWKTDSSFGLMVGFMKSVPGATKQYIPKEGAITFEFLHEGLLGKIWKEKLESEYNKIFKKLPAKVATKI